MIDWKADTFSANADILLQVRVNLVRLRGYTNKKLEYSIKAHLKVLIVLCSCNVKELICNIMYKFKCFYKVHFMRVLCVSVCSICYPICHFTTVK